MIFISRTQTNPFFNIAAEEYVLKHFDEDVLMLWQSTPAVIVGKHQNMVAEVNLNYTRENRIPVIRRVSGGGTVFHDLGNLNYTLIKTEANRERLIDFKKFSAPVMEFLRTLSIQAEFEGKNNLVINGKKFSGNSAHVLKNRVMHHGTLLFNTNLENLEKVIRPPKANIADKAIKSVSATVTNISMELQSTITFEDFRQSLAAFLVDHYQIDNIYHFSEQDIAEINKLVAEKYNTPQWNYGYSPYYEFENTLDGFYLFIKVKKGLVEAIELNGCENSFSGSFKGIMHRYQDINNIIERLNVKAETKKTLLRLFGF
ncbi:MAG: lipoate--protein ligase family protein [Bacteroidetes bacterium]|nr:MAG: lipoate--protein ligase family protein [Bacteroidota bacterium]